MKPDWSFDPILPHMSEEIASRNWRDNCLLTLGWARCLRDQTGSGPADLRC